ncbi:MAG: rhomboid family intramembrane serine protease [Lentisphaeraceae bacterium]|nr:rhomboid family intramembrane serine protease [Lentisphaeraceae bacterium]
MSEFETMKCAKCGATKQFSPATGEYLCLCTYEPVEEVEPERVEVLEDPYVELRRQMQEEKKIGEFVRGINANVKDIYVTKAIIAINIAVFVFMAIKGVSVINPETKDIEVWGGNLSGYTMFGESWRLVSCMFLHIGIIHIFFNMMVLWSLGNLIEKFFGHVNFLLLYFFSGLVGSLASVVWNPFVVSAGASGAVFGVFGAMCGFLIVKRRDLPRTFYDEMKKNAFLFLGLNLAFGFSVPNIDMAAHLGGLVGGLIAALILSQNVMQRKGMKSLVPTLIYTLASAAVIWFSFKEIKKGFEVSFTNIDESLEQKHIEFKALFVENNVKLRKEEISVKEFIDSLEQKVLPELQFIKAKVLSARPFGMTDRQSDRLVKYLSLKE